MSYYAEISFKKLESQDIISFLKDFKYAYIKRIPEIAKENYPFCPAVEKNLLNFQDLVSEDKLELSECLNWAKDRSRFKYFYDNEFKLLGIVGVPECLKELFDASIAFQNSCDQDYEQKAWAGIKEFEDIYTKWITKDVDEVVDSYNLEDDFRDFNADYSDPIEKSEQLMYWRKSFAYREIWGRYEREIFDDDNAIYFSLFGTYESSKLYRILQCCLAEADAAMQSLGLCISNCQKVV